MKVSKRTVQLIKFLFILNICMFSTPFISAQNPIQDRINNTDAGRTDILIPVTDNGDVSSLPVTVIKGAAAGPTFAIIAGIHGYEYPPIMAVQRILKEIDYNRLKGNLIIVPIANLPSFYGRTPFVNPIDKKNLNNVFPGKPDGSITEQFAHIITHDIISISDVLLDIHAGDASEDLLSFICYYNKTDSPQQTRLAERLCEVSGFENIVSYPYNITPDEPAVYAYKQAVQDGKTALSIESGKLGNLQQEAVAETKRAVYNMLEELGMYGLPDEHKAVRKTIQRYNQQTYIKSTCQGIFYSSFSAGDVIEKGNKIGYITDVFGNKLQDITAPASGIILYKVGTPPVNTKETLFCIGYNDESQ